MNSKGGEIMVDKQSKENKEAERMEWCEFMNKECEFCDEDDGNCNNLDRYETVCYPKANEEDEDND